jgi:peptidoglycan hydrolase-like protein with peptidoglycan-binding domain
MRGACLLVVAVIACLPLCSAQPRGKGHGAAQATSASGARLKRVPAQGAQARTAVPPKAAARGKATSAAKTAARGKAPARPAVQLQPTKERYAEIQQALVDRGYLEVADGNWGPQSVEALKRFQRDQDLPVDGKLGALTLIALGLGPRHGAFALPPDAPATGSAPALPLD